MRQTTRVREDRAVELRSGKSVRVYKNAVDVIGFLCQHDRALEIRAKVSGKASARLVINGRCNSTQVREVKKYSNLYRYGINDQSPQPYRKYRQDLLVILLDIMASGFEMETVMDFNAERINHCFTTAQVFREAVECNGVSRVSFQVNRNLQAIARPSGVDIPEPTPNYVEVALRLASSLMGNYTG